MSASTPNTVRTGLFKSILAIGFIALTLGILVANARPPPGYELSIYTATPSGFWIAAGIAMIAALVVSFGAASSRIRATALVLGGSVAAAIVGLPVLRGYYYYGTGDPLTHLGWAKDIGSGVLDPRGLLYPGIHLFADLIQEFLGISLTRAIMLVVLILALMFVVFLPLTVRAITRRPYAVVIATFSALMFFLINTISVHMHAHPFTQTVLFSPLVLFLVVKYVHNRSVDQFITSVTAVGGLLAIAGVAAVLYHPQQAANLIVVFAAISGVQFAYRRYRNNHPIAGHRALYGQTAFLAVVFTLWSAGDSRFMGNIDNIRRAFIGFLTGSPPTAGERIGTQTASLTAIGAGLPEIFVKLFLVSFVYSLVAGFLIAVVVLGRSNATQSTENAFVKYLAAGAAGVGILFLVYFIGGINEHYFRHMGFLMAIMAIIGSIAYARMVSGTGLILGRRGRTAAVAIAIALMLPLSMATIYPSPYIHQQSQHVTEDRLNGYETVFEITSDGLRLGGLSQTPDRYSDAVQGVEASEPYDISVSEEELTDLQRSYGTGYVVISEYDRQRELFAYQQLRYSQQAFDSVENQRGVNRVASNDEVQLYYVTGVDTS